MVESRLKKSSNLDLKRRFDFSTKFVGSTTKVGIGTILSDTVRSSVSVTRVENFICHWLAGKAKRWQTRERNSQVTFLSSNLPSEAELSPEGGSVTSSQVMISRMTSPEISKLFLITLLAVTFLLKLSLR